MTIAWGKLAPQLDRAVRPIVQEGVLEGVTLQVTGPVGGPTLGHVAAAITALGKLPAAASLRAVHVLKSTRKDRPGNGAWHADHTHTRTLAALAAALPAWPLVRTLSLDDYDVDLDLHDAAAAHAFWDAAAPITDLTLRARRFLSATHPSIVRWPAGLARLRIEAQELHRLVFDHLSCELAELRSLDLWLPSLDLLRGASNAVCAAHAPGPGGAEDQDVVSAWLASAHERFPRLEHLGLLLCDDPRLVELVARAPIASQLRSLSFAGGRVGVDGLTALRASARLLERLDLGECDLDEACVAAARRIVPDAEVRTGPPTFLSPIVRLPYRLAVETSWILRWQQPVRDSDPRWASLILAPRPRG